MDTTSLRKRISPKRILVVEDEMLVAHTVRMALAVDGHTVEIAGDGEEAIAKFKEGNYDLVITDFELRKVDGLELAQAIKQVSPASPIILVTGHAEIIKSGMGKVSNIEALLSKPISISALYDAMGRIFPPNP